MEPSPTTDLYSPLEIARAAGVPVAYVRSALREPARGARAARYVPYGDAVRIGRALVWGQDDGLMLRPAASPDAAPLFSMFSTRSSELASPRTFALSSTLPGALIAVLI